ncbi:MAG: glycosyltransferase family 87 protein, partial [Terriglobales bacterium]
MTPASKRDVALFAVLAAAAAALALARPDKAIDFRVYWENTRHYFGGGAAMYGPASGTGWAGGVYRYPPIFLDLFRPLARLPLRWGAAMWAAGQLACAGALAIELRRRWQLPSVLAAFPALLLLAPYAIQELRYGNVQLYIVVLACAAFVAAERHPGWGGLGLGLAAALKVWPLFFFPCLAVQRRWRMLAAALGFGAGFTLAPALWRGWSAQWTLLGQWLGQERAIAATSASWGELWYPGQSLHDVLARYLTRIDYSRLADAAYPQIAWLRLSPAALDRVWWIAAALVLGGMFALLWRARAASDASVALMCCGVVVLEPHVHRLILVTLLWPALYLAAALRRGKLQGWQRALFWFAVAASVLEPLVPGSGRQRALQVYGADFWLVVLPVTAVVA